MPEVDMGYYILNDAREPVHIFDTFEWACWFEAHTADRIVKQEYAGNYRISTVFLGLDHNFSRITLGKSGPPILFETMVFPRFGKRGNDLLCERCSTWAEAEAQHEAIASRIRAATDS